MTKIYKDIFEARNNGNKLLAVLIDPDKFSIKNTSAFIKKVNNSKATHIFVGGSAVDEDATYILVKEIKAYTFLPIVLFPGDVSQITSEADALLFLSLISGRNPDYLIGKHVKSVSVLKQADLEIISTGYILIEGGTVTATSQVTKTEPLSRKGIQIIIDTAKAGEFLGLKLMYLEAGSGAKIPLSQEIIKSVKDELTIPLIVGGGIRNKQQLDSAYNAGADLVVIGTAFEEDESFFNELKK
ncbi:geranylgeranylglyceryl/heptaprenylglyceryl phosphate synthase [Cognatitamlana onchidii]|uniref:geranylgeranylglyceryl/heptaprenylglyceryl phosphate synthase n=1 Tax=Cognatitamlana onchidii TaxID=2562860 RepID=UPI0010A65666|nr:geranylgeranylglyceryl/heptaprenylglyceryl phosphate synthase [Algibacter onchidii]